MTATLPFRLLLASFAARANRQQTSVIAYLLEENRVPKEQLESGGKRLRFTDDQRRRLAAKGSPLGGKVLRQIATIVRPETIRPGDYFKDVLLRLSTCTDVTKLTPHGWQEHFAAEVAERRHALLQQIVGAARQPPVTTGVRRRLRSTRTLSSWRPPLGVAARVWREL